MKSKNKFMLLVAAICAVLGLGVGTAKVSAAEPANVHPTAALDSVASSTHVELLSPAGCSAYVSSDATRIVASCNSSQAGRQMRAYGWCTVAPGVVTSAWVTVRGLVTVATSDNCTWGRAYNAQVQIR